jgi:hypothetical protein
MPLVWCFFSINPRGYLLRAESRRSAMEIAYRVITAYTVLRQMKIEKKTIMHDFEINALDTNNMHIYVYVYVYVYIYPIGLLHASL